MSPLRSLRFAAAVVMLAGLPVAAVPQRTPAPAGRPAVDSLTGIVHSRRLASGVPVGGLGAGTFQVMTDGAISAATYNNNWAHPLGDLPGCFAAVYARSGTRSISRVLALTSTYGLPTVPNLDFDGLCPVAHLAYADPALPVSVSARAFSPLIPHDLRSSTFPAAAFLFRVTNTSGGDVEVSVALSWENTLGAGGSVATGPFDDRAGNTVSAVPDTEGFFALRYARAEAAPSDADARLRNNASGEMTLMAAPGRPQALVTSAVWNALAKMPGWWAGFTADGSVHDVAASDAMPQTKPAGVIAVRLTLRPRETVELPFAISWYTPHLNTTEGGDYGHYYQTIWPSSYSAARGLLTEWHSLLALTEEWQERILFSNLPKWMARRLINSVSPLITHSVFTRDKTFAMLDSVGNPPSSGALIARPAAAGPDFGIGPRPPRPGYKLASLSRRIAVSGLLTDLFPVLSASELRLFMARQAAEGGLPASLGDIDRTIGVPKAGSLAAVEEALVLSNGPHAPLRSAEALGDTSAFLLQMAQYVLRTGDSELLRASSPNVRRALALLLENRDGDGLPTLASGSLTPAGASLFLAALKAGERLCDVSAADTHSDDRLPAGLAGFVVELGRVKQGESDMALARRCGAAGEAAAAGMDKVLWNGRFYAAHDATGREISTVDQLIGVALSDGLGLEGPANSDRVSLLSESHVQTAIGSIQRVNGPNPPFPLAPAAAVKVDGASAAPESRAADTGRAVIGDAALCFTRRQPQTAVALLRRLDETRNDVLLSPWLCPDHFSAETGAVDPAEGGGLSQSSDWSVLAPIEGFAVDLSSGQMSLCPQIPGNWRSLTAPVFTPTFWGRLEFRPSARGGVTSLRVDRLMALPAATASGRLSGSAGLLVTALRVAGPPPRPANAPPVPSPVAHVSRGTTPLGVKSARDRFGDYIITFETPVRLTAGDRLEIDLH
jgi:uncharacterized protein (DUF608 family)